MTTRKAWRQLERQLTFGKDQYLGCAVLAAQHTNHFEAQDNTQRKYPHGHPRGGEDEGPTRTDNQMTKIARNTEEALGNVESTENHNQENNCKVATNE